MARHVIRSVPGTRWVQFWWSRTAEPGNGWIVSGTVYRWCMRLPLAGVRIGVLVMPNRQDEDTFTGSRLASRQRASGHNAPAPSVTPMARNRR